MKIKKPASVKAKGRKIIAPKVENIDIKSGNPTVAAKNGTISKKAVTTTFIFALIALFTTGTLVYIMYRHWEFLMPA